VLADVVTACEAAAKRTAEPNTQAIVEERFQAGLGSVLFAERFVRAATGLVIILGLLGTFYGLTSSIGRLVELLAGDATSTAAITQNVTQGLTQALTGMAVAFSNSLVGVLSAVVLTLVSIVSNPTDRRVALMLSVETYLDGLLASPAFERRAGGADAAAAHFGESVERLDAVVARFDSALQAFSASTREFSEFNAHLKDNVQRMSLSFGDLNDALRQQVTTIKRENGR
jgi:methyl-accepting chemotaxis protein